MSSRRFHYPSSLVFGSGSAIDVVSNIMEALVSFHIHPNKTTKRLVFENAIDVVCNMMEAFVSLGIHPNKSTKIFVEVLINTSTPLLHQLVLFLFFILLYFPTLQLIGVSLQLLGAIASNYYV